LDRNWRPHRQTDAIDHARARGFAVPGVARFVSGRPSLATVQMDTHFVDSAKVGEILLSKPRVVGNTRSLIFLTTEVTADNRCIAMANGVFKS
jgi:acyl-coenzyme A thioesterase PaaI-like protein